MITKLPERQKLKVGTNEIHDVLQGYANRGVFGSFNQDGDTFKFTWLWNLPFELRFRQSRLTFPQLLPHAAPLQTDLRRFIRGCCSKNRPEHRRVDSKRLKVSCVNRRGAIGVSFQIAAGHYEYGTRKAINLVNEIFLSFLSVNHHQYLVEHFRRPED